MRYGTGCLNLCMLIQYIKLSEAIVHMLHWTSSFFQFQFSFAGHQGSSQSDPCTITGFGFFKLLTCDWLREMLYVGLRVKCVKDALSFDCIPVSQQLSL